MSRRDERGSASIDMLMLMPVIFGLLFVTLQAGLYYYGRSAALAVATSGVRAAAAEDGTTAACRSAAEAMLAKAGDALTGATIHCTRTVTNATVTVQGTTLSVVPLVLPHTRQTVSLPVERITG